MTDFRDLVDTEGLEPDEAERLRRVHDLLVQAGPPPDLPPSLEQTPEAEDAEIVQFPLLPRRRWAAVAVAAAALLLIAFAGGYLFGGSKGSSSFAVERVVPMRAPVGQAQAIIRIAAVDEGGNWPMELEVTDLPKQPARGSYYELWLTQNGKPVEPCGTFRVGGSTTTVRLSVPYDFSKADGWVVTAQRNGAAVPGRVVLTT
jgi:anti-sigma-K factor RskA